jgi:hypothetical protein
VIPAFACAFLREIRTENEDFVAQHQFMHMPSGVEGRFMIPVVRNRRLCGSAVLRRALPGDLVRSIGSFEVSLRKRPS